MKQTNEELLSAWLRLSVTICNKRIVSEMSYNEAIVCNLLYHQRNNCPGEYLTATDLCERTKMLKSLMNRTINHLEKKGIVERKRSNKDKRQIYVILNENKIDIYEKEHEEILKTVQGIMNEIGSEHVDEVIKMFHNISDVAEKCLKNQ